MVEIDIGTGKSARRAYVLDDITIVPSRRTRDRDDVDTSWRIDAYRFDLPVLAAAIDGPLDTNDAVEVGRSGALPVIELEPLAADTGALKDVVSEMRDAGVHIAARCSPRRARELTPAALAAEFDVLVIQGDVVSAEHVSKSTDPLNLKTFIRELDIPVLVGGCGSQAAALHLMRTGAAGILVGVDRPHLGIGVPLATAVADARSARVRHRDETGVYCHVIAVGGIRSGADAAKAVACGADAVMVDARVVTGADAADLAGSLRRAMATCGYTDLKSFQEAEVVVR